MAAEGAIKDETEAMPTARHFLSSLTIADNISFGNKRRLKCEGSTFSNGFFTPHQSVGYAVKLLFQRNEYVQMFGLWGDIFTLTMYVHAIASDKEVYFIYTCS